MSRIRAEKPGSSKGDEPSAAACVPVLAKVGLYSFLAYVAVVLLAVVAVASDVAFRFKSIVTGLNPVLFAVAAFIGAALVIGAVFAIRTSVAKRALGFVDSHFAVFVGVAFVLLIVCQVVIVNHSYFRTDWDVEALYGRAKEGLIDQYLWKYPNNMAIYLLYRLAHKVCAVLGLGEAYYVLVLLGAFCVAASVALAAFSMRRIAGVGAAVALLAFGSVYIGMNPWIDVPYTDTYAMLFVALSVFSYVCIERPWLRWGLLGLSGMLGYYLKPTCIFIVLAIVFVEVLAWIRRRVKDRRACGLKACVGDESGCAGDGRAESAGESACESAGESGYAGSGSFDWKAGAKVVCAFIVGAAIPFLAHAAIMDHYSDRMDPDAPFSAAHFLMMGVNEEFQGAYSPDDVDFSMSFETQEERNAADLAKWRERVGELGPVGLAKLLFRKTLSNYGDGTFAWRMEGIFFYDAPHKDGLLGRFFMEDWKPSSYLYIAQVAWFFMLLGVVLCFFGKADRRVCAIAIALLALSVFITVFECRARYLFLYAPCFLIMAFYGWKAMYARIRTMASKAKKPSENA